MANGWMANGKVLFLHATESIVVASITEGDPGAESERASHSAPG